MALPKIYECTCLESKEGDVIVYTDEGGENPILIPRYRLKDLMLICMDALFGEASRR